MLQFQSRLTDFDLPGPDQTCQQGVEYWLQTDDARGGKMNRILRKAMSDSDRYVIEMDYSDAKGNRTRRLVSPIRFMGSYRFLGLCLCREQPRQFQLSRCRNMRLLPSADVLAPVAIA